MLKVVVIIFGLFLAVTRGLGCVYPTKMRTFVTNLVSKETHLRAWGASLFILSFIIFVAVWSHVSLLAFIMLIIGILSLIGAFTLVFFPAGYRALADWFLRLPDRTLRIFYGIGFAIGVFILILGILYQFE